MQSPTDRPNALVCIYGYYKAWLSLFHALNTKEQAELNLPIGKIKLIHHANGAAVKVLCLHGWLDNRASFLPIIPYLQDMEYAAVDMVGHGESAHRDVNSLNHYINYVRDIKLILDGLGWKQCHILGHSMGGSVGLIAASVYPECIQSLAMLDVLHPARRSAEEGPAMLRKTLQQFANWDNSRQKVFPSLDAATSARLQASPFPQTRENAHLIMQYATEKVATGYRLRSDSRLNFRSPIMLNREQVNAFIKAVKQPVLAMLATQGIVQRDHQIETTLKLFHNIQTHYIHGGHHFHMEKPAETAQTYRCFLEQL